VPSERRFTVSLDERPGHLIRRLQQISFALFMEQARAFAITPVQYAAIFAVSENPGIDQTALCNIVALDRSTVADVVTRLERKKLIRRLPGPHDRRTKVLYPTPLAQRLLDDIEPAVAATQRLILAPLKPAERAAFMQLLKQLVRLNNDYSRAPSRPNEAPPANRPVRAKTPTARARRR